MQHLPENVNTLEDDAVARRGRAASDQRHPRTAPSLQYEL